MKIAEMRKKSNTELEHLVAESRKKLQELRFALGGGKVKNVREIRNVKKVIAQALTLVRLQDNKAK